MTLALVLFLMFQVSYAVDGVWSSMEHFVLPQHVIEGGRRSSVQEKTILEISARIPSSYIFHENKSITSKSVITLQCPFGSFFSVVFGSNTNRSFCEIDTSFVIMEMVQSHENTFLTALLAVSSEESSQISLPSCSFAISTMPNNSIPYSYLFQHVSKAHLFTEYLDLTQNISKKCSSSNPPDLLSFSSFLEIGEDILSSVESDNELSIDDALDESFFAFIETSERVQASLMLGIQAKQVMPVAVDAVKQMMQQLLIKLFEKTVLPPISDTLLKVLDPALMAFFMDMSTIGNMSPPTNVPSNDFEQIAGPLMGIELSSQTKGLPGRGSITTKMKAEFVSRMTNELLANDQLQASEILHSSLGESLGVVVNRTVSRTVSRALIMSLTESLTLSLLELLVSQIKQAVTLPIMQDLTQVLTPGLTHAISSTIRKSLSRDPREDHFCFFCENHRTFCDECYEFLRQEFIGDHIDTILSHHYSAWYSSFYSHPTTIDYFLASSSDR